MSNARKFAAGGILAVFLMVLTTTSASASWKKFDWKDRKCKCGTEIKTTTTIVQTSSNRISNNVLVNSNTGGNEIEKNVIGKAEDGDIDFKLKTGASIVSVWIQNKDVGHNELSL